MQNKNSKAIPTESNSSSNPNSKISISDVSLSPILNMQRGYDYQKALAMMFLWNGFESQESYKELNIVREVQDMYSFDDIVIRYKETKNNKSSISAVQVKERKDSLKIKDLLSNNRNSDSLISNFFHDYLEIKARSELERTHSIISNSELQDLILLTNNDIESNSDKSFFTISNKSVIKCDLLLDDSTSNTVIYTIDGSKIDNLALVLYNTSDFFELITLLSNEDLKIDLREDSIFIRYIFIMSHILSSKGGTSDEFDFSKLIKNDYNGNQYQDIIGEIRKALITELAFKRYKVDLSKIEEIQQPNKSATINSKSALETLAEKLTKKIVSKDSEYFLDDEKSFLLNNVIKNTNGTYNFKDEFIERKKLSTEALAFRRILLDKFCDNNVKFKINNNSCSIQDFSDEIGQNLLSNNTIKLSKQFAKTFEKICNPHIENPDTFANQMASLINEAKNNTIDIDEYLETLNDDKEKNEFKDNITNILNHVLVTRAGNLRFSTSFLQETYTSTYKTINEFRNALKSRLFNSDNNVQLSSLLNKIKIKFKTNNLIFKDRKLFTRLPTVHKDENTKYFLEKFKMICKYPSLEEIRDILDIKIKIKTKLSLDDDKYFPFSLVFYYKIKEWFDNNKEIIYNSQDFKKLIESIKNKFYLNKSIEDYFSFSFFTKCKFNPNTLSKKVNDFLSREENKYIILNGHTELVSANLIQALNENDTYSNYSLLRLDSDADADCKKLYIKDLMIIKPYDVNKCDEIFNKFKYVKKIIFVSYKAPESDILKEKYECIKINFSDLDFETKKILFK